MVRFATEVIKNKNMENAKAQLLDRLKTADNILVTVSSNPTVDQLSAAIGLTLMLNKIGKQGTAVFSGKVPSTIQFLQPEKTIEKNTDSLRDFIIALDKSKADKLRYKVEDNHVKIFITPYKTAISEKDLQFSQGDFNVQVVIALGVREQKDLDRAITAHGRILHDATTISVTNGEPGSVGSIDWDDKQASSLSEMIASLATELGPDSLDGQIATALMTGIVSQTERFRNARTTPATMNVGSALMAAGANQQLIATKLEQTEKKPAEKKPEPKEEHTEQQASKEASTEVEPAPVEEPKDEPGSLRIEHDEQPEQSSNAPQTEPEPTPEADLPEVAPQQDAAEPEAPEEQGDAQAEKSSIVGGGSLILEPPTLGGKLTANSEPEHLDAAIDSLGAKPVDRPLLQRQDRSASSASEQASSVHNPLPSDLPTPVSNEPPAVPDDLGVPVQDPALQDATTQASSEELTLSELTANVQQSYDQPQLPEVPEPVEETPAAAETEETPDISGARDAVSDALASINQAQALPPIDALNAQPLAFNDQLGAQAEPAVPVDYFSLPSEPNADQVDQFAVTDFTVPEDVAPQATPTQSATTDPAPDPTAPPAVPPPFMPPGMAGYVPPQPPSNSGNQPQAQQPGNPFNLPPA